jgi:Na+/melibiose symporter-like transporter
MDLAVSLVSTAVFFVIGWIISTIIIYAVTSLLGEKEGIGTALLAALVGAIIYALAYYFLGQGLIAGLVGGFVWLLALGSLYEIGWLKALLTAVIVWIVAIIVGWFLPTIIGPL